MRARSRFPIPSPLVGVRCDACPSTPAPKPRAAAADRGVGHPNGGFPLRPAWAPCDGVLPAKSMSMRATDAHDPAVEPMRPDASLGDLFGELTGQMSDLFRQELELARTEAKQEFGPAGKAAGMLAGAGVAACIALLLASFALAWLLDQALNTALSFLIVGVIWAIVAAVLAASGRRSIIRPGLTWSPMASNVVLMLWRVWAISPLSSSGLWPIGRPPSMWSWSLAGV